MQGSLAFHAGVLYVGRHARSAKVASYDLDGHALETRFTFCDARRGRSSADGLAVDGDHRIWVADGAARCVRAFTLFGQEVACVGGAPEDELDAFGRLGVPAGVATLGADDDLHVVVASRGLRRHALQVLHPASGRARSLRPRGEPEGAFHGLCAVDVDGRDTFVCEAERARVQVFRDTDFHFEFPVPAPPGARVTGLACLPGGRVVVTVAGTEAGTALLLLDAAGRLARVLARGGEDDGALLDPADVAAAAGARDADTRVAVIDRDGERVQVFTLAGRCYGSFTDLNAL